MRKKLLFLLTTLLVTLSANAQYEYVDLGLPSGTLWATCNVGASSPEEFGDFFCWGETDGKKDWYDYGTYKYCMGSHLTLTKYCNNSEFGYNGFTDDKLVLDPEDDAATVNMGEDWCTPTLDQLYELGKCTRKWTEQNGVGGILFTGPNGNKMFLPAAGLAWRDDPQWLYMGRYLSNECNKGFCPTVWYLSFYYYQSVIEITSDGGRREYGCPVRAVRVPTKKTEVYTEFVESTGTLTYYYDDQMSSRSGITEVYDKDYGLKISYKSDVLKAVIDPSMKDAPLTSTYRMFYGLENMKSIHGLENLNTTNVTNMRCMFYGCNALTSLNLSSFNTANVTDMSDMFTACFQLKSLDLSSFNTANVTNMGAMFSGCSSLTSLDLSSFNTQNVTNMVDMFGGCYSLTSLDVSSLNTENVTNMWAMFSGCSSLTSLDLSSFNTQNVTTMERMFFGCYSLTSLDVSSFNTENVTNMDRMFFYCKSLTSLDLSSFNTQKVTEMVNMFDNCLSLKTIFCNDDWGKSSVLEYSKDMFSQCGSLVGGRGTKWTSDIIDARYARPDGGTSQPGYFTKYGAEVYTEFVAETGTLTYYYDNKREERTGVTELYDPINTPNAVRFNDYNHKIVKAVIDPSMKNAPLTSTNGMFYGGTNSETFSIKTLYKMTTIEGLENLNTAIITDMESMFFSCSALTMLDLSSFNTSSATSMNGMFFGCDNLEVVDVSSFDISNVTDMYVMFSGCTKLKTIYCYDDWSTSPARSGYMFFVCNSLVGGKGTVFDSKVIDNTYARPDGGESAPGYFTDDSLTGIKKVQDVQKVQGVQENIYNLSGQRVNKPVQKGLYIINGKKISVK